MDELLADIWEHSEEMSRRTSVVARNFYAIGLSFFGPIITDLYSFVYIHL